MTQTEENVQAAKAFLLKSEEGQVSAYDHLVTVLKKGKKLLYKVKAIMRRKKGAINLYLFFENEMRADKKYRD